MNKILNYGSLSIDHVFVVNNIVKPGETISSRSFSLHPGGKGENQSGALAKAGLDVFHAGKIGKDGLLLLENLQNIGVKTDYLCTNGSSTGWALIQVDLKGQNAIFLKPGGNEEITKEEIDITLSHFEKGDYLVLQNEINNVDYLINKGAEKKLKICFNPSPFDSSIFSLPLQKVSMFFINEIEGALLAQVDKSANFEQIMHLLVSIYPNAEIILTAGEHGSYYGNSETLCFQPIIKSKVVDTTAAGDTFLGYFLASKIYNYNPQECLYNATKASSITISKLGALEAIPDKKDIFETPV